MKGKLLLAVAFVVQGALGVAVAVGATGGTNRASATLRVIERASSDTLTENGKKGDSVGDVLTFANTILELVDPKGTWLVQDLLPTLT